MLRHQPQHLVHSAIRLSTSLHAQTSTYATTKLPDANGLNYPLLMKLYNEYLDYRNSPNANPFKLKAFGKAMDAIESLPFKVQKLEDAEKLEGIGVGMKRRIEEFLSSEEENSNMAATSQNIANKKELLDAVKLFQTISGIGPQRARKLAEKGFRTLDDVIKEKETLFKLPKGVQVTLLYSSMMIDRIPRADISRLAEKIERTLKGFEVHIAGSYRRGALSSSDIHVLLFHPSATNVPPGFLRKTTKENLQKLKRESLLLGRAVPALRMANILADEFTGAPTKWQGLAKLDEQKFCRIDLNLLPSSVRGAALIGLTGDAGFNRYLQDKANTLCMRLNDFGLWKRPNTWDPLEELSEKSDMHWELVDTMTEEDVFNHLGEEWVEPKQRNFGNLVGKRKGRVS